MQRSSEIRTVIGLKRYVMSDGTFTRIHHVQLVIRGAEENRARERYAGVLGASVDDETFETHETWRLLVQQPRDVHLRRSLSCALFVVALGLKADVSPITVDPFARCVDLRPKS